MTSLEVFALIGLFCLGGIWRTMFTCARMLTELRDIESARIDVEYRAALREAGRE